MDKLTGKKSRDCLPLLVATAQCVGIRVGLFDGSPMTHASRAPAASDRSFGWLMAALLAGLCVYSVFKTAPAGASVAWGAAAALVAGVALWSPQWLAPFNRLWMRLGMWMGRVVNPVVFGVMFFGLITPIALVTRWAGRDVLRLKPRSAPSHWVDRAPTGPTPESFKNQF